MIPVRRPGSRGRWAAAVLVAALLLVLTVTTAVRRSDATLSRSSSASSAWGSPGSPSPDGYFRTLPAGAWRSLDGDAACARRVHRSDWEPRPSNDRPNHTRPDAAAVRASLTQRPRGDGTTYDARFNSWLLPRVDGQHTGTTDENIQWAACKWGISDNVLRAMAAAESTWYQYLVGSGGRCVEERGCGDVTQTRDAATRTFCREEARFGHDYTRDYGAATCPRTFSIIGVMSWQAPHWGRMEGNQNGTFPFNRDSTAFALDYAAANLRGCLEGWEPWLDEDGGYRPGDLWGCVGVWYAGAWETPDARDYTARVRQLLAERVWLRPGFAESADHDANGTS